MNGVKLADIMFSLLCVCVSVCAYMAAVFHTQYVNANCSNTVKDTDFKFDNHVHRDSPDMTPQKIFEKGPWPGSHDSQNLWALYANCSKTVAGMNFRFDKHVPRESPDMAPRKILEKGRGQGLVTP